MDYKEREIKKRIGSFGRANVSNYINPRDSTAPYRKASAPESQYSRSFRNKIHRDEVEGTTNFRTQNYHYDTKQPFQGISRSEINRILDERFEEMKETPHEFMLTEMGDMPEVKEKISEVSENQRVDKLLELNDVRQEKVNERMSEFDQTSSIEEADRISTEVKEINSNFFGQMDSLEPDTSRRELQKKRTSYDSEIGGY